MKRVIAAALLAVVAAAAPSFADGMQAGVSFGPTWALSGESPLSINEFKDEFESGWGFAGYVAGPLSDRFGWRVEGGWDKLDTDPDAIAVDGEYKVFRLMGGIQIAPFRSEGSGMPYAFFCLGLAREDASIDVPSGGASIDFDSRNAFGLSFGGGYNHLIGESWGVGGDLHINMGKFEDDTRFWWTPSGQLFFKF